MSIDTIIKHITPADGNVFADLGLPDAEMLKIKSDLVIDIRKAIRRLGLTQQDAADLMGITHPEMLEMIRDPSNLSEQKLADCLSRLGGGLPGIPA